MPPSPQDVEHTFQRKVDELAQKAIAAYGLTFTQTAQADLSEPLLRWTDFTLRYIAPAQRQIVISSKFPINNLPSDAEAGLHHIEQLILSGGEVNPYQSRTLTQFNDTSGTKSKKRTDGLWADWGIHHLHLPGNPVAPGDTYSARSDWVLFLKVYSDAVLFIDVRQHEANLFCSRELVETYIRNWPDDAAKYRLHGVSGLTRQPTDVEHGQLRNGGVNMMIEVDGRVYAPPGMGITTAVTALRVGRLRDRIRANTRLLAQEVARADGQFMQEMKAQGIPSPTFQLILLPDGGIGVHEEASNYCWRLPRVHPNQSDDLYSTWHNEFMPAWAGQRVAQHP